MFIILLFPPFYKSSTVRGLTTYFTWGKVTSKRLLKNTDRNNFHSENASKFHKEMTSNTVSTPDVTVVAPHRNSSKLELHIKLLPRHTNGSTHVHVAQFFPPNQFSENPAMQLISLVKKVRGCVWCRHSSLWLTCPMKCFESAAGQSFHWTGLITCAFLASRKWSKLTKNGVHSKCAPIPRWRHFRCAHLCTCADAESINQAWACLHWTRQNNHCKSFEICLIHTRSQFTIGDLSYCIQCRQHYWL